MIVIVYYEQENTMKIWIMVPGSLSDRWSSLTTIYPLRFHEIFGRWLSFNMI